MYEKSMDKSILDLRYVDLIYNDSHSETIHSNLKNHITSTVSKQNNEHMAKYMQIQQLLLSAHPTIARFGGTSSFSKFSLNAKK